MSKLVMQVAKSADFANSAHKEEKLVSRVRFLLVTCITSVLLVGALAPAAF